VLEVWRKACWRAARAAGGRAHVPWSSSRRRCMRAGVCAQRAHQGFMAARPPGPDGLTRVGGRGAATVRDHVRRPPVLATGGSEPPQGPPRHFRGGPRPHRTRIALPPHETPPLDPRPRNVHRAAVDAPLLMASAGVVRVRPGGRWPTALGAVRDSVIDQPGARPQAAARAPRALGWRPPAPDPEHPGVWRRGSQLWRGGSWGPRGVPRSPAQGSASTRVIQAWTVGRETFRTRRMRPGSEP
jgi:hypothetical protein